MKQHSNLGVLVLSVCTRFLTEGIPLPAGFASPLLQLLWLQAQPPVSFYCTTLDGRKEGCLQSWASPCCSPLTLHLPRTGTGGEVSPGQRDASEAGGESGQCKEC